MNNHCARCGRELLHRGPLCRSRRACDRRIAKQIARLAELLADGAV